MQPTLPRPPHPIALALCILAACSHGPTPAASNEPPPQADGSPALITTQYRADETPVPNPERGFYHYTNLARLDPDVGRIRADGLTLIWGQILLEDYRDSPSLPSAFLQALESGFDIARQQGLKVIVRGSYGHKGPGGDYTTYADPPADHIKKHLAQLAPLFAAHADVIALFEAGFIGPWGEWHTTAIARQYDQGRELFFHILDHTPADRMVLVRYPYLKQRLFASGGSFEQVDATNAYSSLPVARVGHHNDCFLASSTDMGTYDRGGMDRTEETAYLAEETLHTVFGGETCSPHALSDCGRAVEELTTLHASYLNNSYHPQVLEKWRQQGCYEQIQQRLGARFVLLQSRLTAHAVPGCSLTVEIDLENRGFASLYNPRPVELVLRHDNSDQSFALPLDTDPRTWKPGQAHHLAAAITLPQTVPAGTYSAYLHLPDPAPRLHADPRYAYRLANTGVWEAQSGYNKLAAGLAIEAD
ncbi:MAG: DUF4832 domain-containing protein [Candidatus Latescibacteria bacterium]|nr:DUF4832 domain-containing protein [Candidatus Latescibacterota bacterium]